MAIDPWTGCNFVIDSNVPCTQENCCLAQSSSLYLPIWGGKLFSNIHLAVLCLPPIWLSIRYRERGYAIGMLIGLILEAVGYAGCVMLQNDPFNSNAFLV